LTAAPIIPRGVKRKKNHGGGTAIALAVWLDRGGERPRSRQKKRGRKERETLMSLFLKILLRRAVPKEEGEKEAPKVHHRFGGAEGGRRREVVRKRLNRKVSI